jgi:hypothetical protein
MIKTISADEYHSSEGLSASIAKVLLSKSPYHAWLCSPLNPHRVCIDSSIMDIGTACHAMLLEGRDVVEVCDFLDWRTKASQEARDSAREKCKIPLLTAKYAEVLKMYDKAIKDSLLAGYDLSKGKAEQSLFWTNDGTKMRARLDWLSDDKSIIIDYKTTGLESPSAWIRSITSNGMDLQPAHYIDAVEHTHSITPTFIWMVQETESPYMVYFVEPSAGMLEIGRQKMAISRKRWQECSDRNEWPEYESGVMVAEPPAWAFAEIEEKLITQETWNELAFRFGRVPDKEYKK